MITAEAISGILGLILPFVLEYLPKLRDTFANLSTKQKPLVVLLICFLIALGSLALSCYGVIVSGVSCPVITDTTSAVRFGIQLGLTVVTAAGASQTAFAIFIGSKS